MFLRHNKRTKDGKVHRYWSIVENRRISPSRTVQKTVLYLGEINDSERAAWTTAISVLDENQNSSQLCLFPADRKPDPEITYPSIHLSLRQMELSRPRQWGACWIALELWDQLKLDEFWSDRLPHSRENTPWLKVLKTLVVYRLLDPGSEWKLHRLWFDRSAMADLLEDNFRLASKYAIYTCHDLLLKHKSAMFRHLKSRWSELFQAQYDVLLYDLTSTYFEVDANGSVAENSEFKAFGYSRDKRPDCLQVVIALIITPEGFPLGYEVMRGNTSDKTTLSDMLQKIASQYGQERRIWLMDRGIPTEASLAEMRASEPAIHYLVGTPKGRLTKLEKELAEKPWEQAKSDVTVKLLPKDKELYILAQSTPRREKERAMRRKKLKRYWARLGELQGRKTLTRDQLLLAIGAAREKAGRNAYRLVKLILPEKNQEVTSETFRFYLDKEKLRRTRRHEGRYLLRSNLSGKDPAELWQYYIQLVRIEESFRILKNDLNIRPIHHQSDQRIEAHIFISFLSYCLYQTLNQHCQRAAVGLSARSVLEQLSGIQMLDVTIPTTDGRQLFMRRYTKPDKIQQLLLYQLHFELPAQPPPEIRYSSALSD